MPLFELKVFLRSLFGEGIWAILQRLSIAPRHRLTRICQRQTRLIVRSGPFEGMKLDHGAVSGAYIPKLLGIYERELHEVITGLNGLRIRRVINIGAGDGYYAVGLSKQLPHVHVIAFETLTRGRRVLHKLAVQNDTAAQLDVRGRCDLEDLRSALEPPADTLVFCDVEGFEDVLLDPEKIGALRSAWLLVELHDGKNPGVSDRIRERFDSSHSIKTIWQQQRAAADFPFRTPYTLRLSSNHLEVAVNEGRPVREGISPMHWFWMKPKVHL